MIDLKPNNKYFGFVLKSANELPDVHSTAYLFTHEKSGANLYYLKNDDDNKVFSITFKTPPIDNCGTPHILEHSVLCGSKKFPVKDPFNELAKGSLNTYLNALTYSDKTMYPVASTNQKDLMNMMDVYLDAVFYPRIFDLKEIFLQEGWHYEWDSNGELNVSGVVYNEMKGAYSDPESVLQNCISQSLFKTSIYGLESGGNPADIPNLSYEAFLEFHKKYYHPSNSFIYLYGDMEVEKLLEFIDKEYLSAFNKTYIASEISLEPPADKLIKLTDTYPVEELKAENLGFLAYNVKAGNCTDAKGILALQILNEILMETNASPLKKAIIKSGLAIDAEGWFDSSALEMVYSIVGKKADATKIDEFKTVIETELKHILSVGIDKKLVESCIQKYEFYFREEDFGRRPRGLTYGMKLMKSWLHGNNPAEALSHWKYFNEIKAESKNRFFENLISSLLIDNTQKSIVSIAPEVGKQQSIDEAFRKEMAAKKSAMNSSEIEQINKDLNSLLSFQTNQENEENLKTIPMLEIGDISKDAHIVPLEVIEISKCKLLFSPLDTNGIVYTQLLFDTTALPEELLPYAGLLAHTLGRLDTAQYSYDSLPTELGLHTGGLYCTNDIYSLDTMHCKPFFAVNGKALVEKQQNLIEFFEEILLNTDFKQYDSLKKIIGRAKILREGQLINRPHTTAILKSAASIALGSHRKDMVAGITFCHFLENLSYDNIVQIAENLKKTLSLLLNANALTVAVACNREYVSSFIMSIEKLISNLPYNDNKIASQPFVANPISQAFTSSSKVQYNALCQSFLNDGYTYSGHMRLLKKILNLEYLWNKVRVQGGAYGSGCNFQRNGIIYFYSYRDPNIKNTFSAYQNSGEFLEDFCRNTKNLDKFIIGTINAMDQPKTNAEKFDLALSRYFTAITNEILQIERNDVLSAQLQDIEQFIPLLNKLAIDNICTIGNNNAIKNTNGYFKKIMPLIP